MAGPNLRRLSSPPTFATVATAWVDGARDACGHGRLNMSVAIGASQPLYNPACTPHDLLGDGVSVTGVLRAPSLSMWVRVCPVVYVLCV